MTMAPLDVVAEMQLEDGRRWTEAATDRQIADLRAVLVGEQPFHFQTRPRGGSKTTDAAVVALAWLQTAPAGARGFWAAADRDQAALGLETMRSFLNRGAPTLRSQIEVSAHRLTAASGASIETLPADAASSWGLRPELLIVDEFSWWADTSSPRQFWESISSAVAKSATARMLILTSPSAPTHFSHRVLEEARGSDLWRVSEQVGLVDWLDPARVAEQRARLPEPMFRRLFLGEWCEGDDTLAAGADVDACITHEGRLEPVSGRKYAIGVDLGVRNDRTAVTIAHKEGETVVVDHKAVWSGSRLRPVSLEAVEQWLKQAARSYRGAELVVDPWQALSMVERLRTAGLRVHEFAFSTQSTGRLAGAMVDLLRGRRLALPDDDELLDELREVRLVERAPGQYRIDHARGKHDDQVISLALAAQHLLKQREAGPAKSIPNGITDGWKFRKWRAERDREEAAAERRAHPSSPPPPQRVGRFLIRR